MLKTIRGIAIERGSNLKLQLRYSTVVSTLALVVALTDIGAQAAGVFVTSKQIKNGTILTQDIHKAAVQGSDIGKGAVGSSDIKTGAVQTADIGEGQVTPGDVTMPEPAQLQEGDTAAAEIGDDFTLLDSVGTYTKVDPASLLEVDWTGSAGSPHGTGCIFQLRVDGQPSASGAGVVFVQAPNNLSVSATALFGDLPAGPHTIEVWARQSPQSPGTTGCIVGPASAGIGQTFVVSEQVV